MNTEDPERLPFVDGVDARTALEHHLCRKAVLLSARVQEAETEEERAAHRTRLHAVEAEIANLRQSREQSEES
ncbi:MAG: hypothetical protein JXA87_12425 [Thermoleophilia bacterium]|nr:hypothetical protein [Thermoleophilia bacterium]